MQVLKMRIGKNVLFIFRDNICIYSGCMKKLAQSTKIEDYLYLYIIQ